MGQLVHTMGLQWPVESKVEKDIQDDDDAS